MSRARPADSAGAGQGDRVAARAGQGANRVSADP